MAKLIKIAGMLLQTKVYLFWKKIDSLNPRWIKSCFELKSIFKEEILLFQLFP